jgi:hypothetical protein
MNDQPTQLALDSPLHIKTKKIQKAFLDSPARNTRSQAQRFSKIEFEFDSDAAEQPEIIIKERGC